MHFDSKFALQCSNSVECPLSGHEILTFLKRGTKKQILRCVFRPDKFQDFDRVAGCLEKERSKSVGKPFCKSFLEDSMFQQRIPRERMP